MARIQKEPTTTSLVSEALKSADDFMSYQMLVDRTGRSLNQVVAALHHLRKHHAVDVVVNPDGRGWWYALPDSEDTRSRNVDMRAPESKPRKPRAKRR